MTKRIKRTRQNNSNAWTVGESSTTISDTVDSVQPQLVTQEIMSTPIDLTRYLDKYDGRQDLTRFLEKFDIAAQNNQWDEQIKSSRLQLMLSGQPDMIVASIPREQRSYEAIVTALKTMTPTPNPVLERARLQQRRQGPHEPVETYAMDIRTLCSRVNSTMHDTDIRGHFVDGLLADIRNHLLLREQLPPTFAETIKEAQRLQAVLSLHNHQMISQSRDTSTSGTIMQVATVPVYGFSRGHTTTNKFTPRSRTTRRWNRFTPEGIPICNNCQKVGHISAACSELQWRNAFKHGRKRLGYQDQFINDNHATIVPDPLNHHPN